MKTQHAKRWVMIIAYFLTIIGAINWLFIGLGMGNPVQSIAGSFSNTIYILVGISGVIALIHKLMWLNKKR